MQRVKTMKNKLTLVAIALWVMTAVIGGLLFIRGSTKAGPDGRTAILLQAGERDFILEEMRTLLVAVRDIAEGLAQDDRAKVTKAARSVGMAAARDTAPMLMAKLPLDFKRLGLPLHQGFDDLADAVERGESSSALSLRLVGQLDRCVACHASFRLEVGQPR